MRLLVLNFNGNIISEGNVTQFLLLWSKENNDVQIWLRENCYTSHQAVNERKFGPSLTMRMITGVTWYSFLADDAS